MYKNPTGNWNIFRHDVCSINVITFLLSHLLWSSLLWDKTLNTTEDTLYLFAFSFGLSVCFWIHFRLHKGTVETGCCER